MNENKEKQAILVLHGWGGSAQSWKNCVDHFDKSKYKLFTPDLPGFGTSAAPEKPWSVQDYANHVKKLMKEYEIEKPVCIAHSFGGRIAIKLASKNKNLFSKLFLIGAAGIKKEPSLKIKIFRLLAKTGKKLLKITGLSKLENLARKVLYKIARAPDYYKTQGPMRETFKKVIDEDLSGLLKEIQIETHIIWGDKDSYVPVSDAHIMNNEIKNSTLKVIKNGKHGLHIQMPEKLAEIIKSYLK